MNLCTRKSLKQYVLSPQFWKVLIDAKNLGGGVENRKKIGRGGAEHLIKYSYANLQMKARWSIRLSNHYAMIDCTPRVGDGKKTWENKI